MSTSILYHAFGLKDVEYHSTYYIGNSVILSATMKDKFAKCPDCGSRQSVMKGKKERWLRMSPCGRKQSFLKLLIHRLLCSHCGKLWWPQLSFTDGKHRYTRSFALTVLDLLQFGTIQAVAHYLNVGWDVIKNIHKSHLHRLYRKMPLCKVKYLGIDEFSIRKGHNYMTIFIDLQEGRVLHAIKGKSKEDVQPFLKVLASKARKLKAVAMDMSSAYYQAVSEYLPGVDVVFDRYHVMALMNNTIDTMRRELQTSLDETAKKTLKGCRFLLLRNYESLTPGYQVKLNSLLQINQPLFIAHTLKEQLRLLWEQASRSQAQRFLKQWCFDAFMSSTMPLIKMAKTILKLQDGILNYFPHRITSGGVEGLINKIKTMKRQAYGFRDMEYFKLRLYHLHCQRYSLTG